MTLMTLGMVPFEVYPFNTHEYSVNGSAPWVSKPVLGAKPPLEFVGDDADTIIIKGKLLPIKLGGLGSLEAINAAKASGQPQYLMRGDGKPLGWFVITKLNATSTLLDISGVGNLVEFDITLMEAGAPTAESHFLSIFDFL